jgi:phage head maturation protease
MMVQTTKAQAAPGPADVTTIKGQIVTFGEEFERWGVRLKYEPGSIRLPESGVKSVKLCVQHDRDRPIGYCTSIAETDTGLIGSFELPPMEHTAAYRAEIDTAVRDGLSVGVFLDEECMQAIDDTMWARFMEGEEQADPIVLTGELGETSAVTIPQFDSARVDNSRQGGTMPRTLVTTSTEDQAPAPTAAPQAAERLAAPARTRPVSAVLELAARITSAKIEGGQGRAAAVIQTIETALSDVTPAGNGAGNADAGLAVQAMGELVDDTEYETLYESIVTARPLTGAKITGWRWKVKPITAPYTGNKTDIPSNPATLEWVEETPNRIAGGHDIDRIYRDLGSPEMLASYWRIMALDVLQQYDSARLSAAKTAAGAAVSAGSTAEAVLAGLTAVKRATYVLISQDLATAEGIKPADTLPAAFASGNLFTGTVPSNIIISPDLTSQVLVGRRSAVDFFSLQPPVRLEAVVVAKAGIDTGMYGYYGDLVAQLSGQKLYTVTTTPLAANASKK